MHTRTARRADKIAAAVGLVHETLRSKPRFRLGHGIDVLSFTCRWTTLHLNKKIQGAQSQFYLGYLVAVDWVPICKEYEGVIQLSLVAGVTHVKHNEIVIVLEFGVESNL